MKRLSFFFLACVLGCDSVAPEPEPFETLLSTYFTPLNSTKQYIWVHGDERPGENDSLFLVSYIGQDGGSTFDGYSPIALFRSSDTLRLYPSLNKYYISDSAVIEYGASSTSDTDRIVLLRDTLKVGKQWEASTTYKAADGAVVRMEAEVDAYYPSMFIGSKDYLDVYRVSYYMTPDQPTIDPAYHEGARHVHYYAKHIGKVLEYVYAADSSLIWKDELWLEKF